MFPRPRMRHLWLFVGLALCGCTSPREYAHPWDDPGVPLVIDAYGENSIDWDRLATEPRRVGFRLPAFEKSALFPTVARRGVLPRKAFSLGEAEEKRFYLEARRLGPSSD